MNENENMINPLDPLGGAIPVQDGMQPQQQMSMQGMQQVNMQMQMDNQQAIFQQGIQQDNQQAIFQQGMQQAEPQMQMTNQQAMFGQQSMGADGSPYQPSVSLQTGNQMPMGFGQIPQQMQAQQQIAQPEPQLSPKEQKKLEKQKAAEEKKKAAEEKKRLAAEAKAEKARQAKEAKEAKAKAASETKVTKPEKKGGFSLFGKKKQEEETASQQQVQTQVQSQQLQMYTQEQLMSFVAQGMITQEQANQQWMMQLQYMQNNGLQQEPVMQPQESTMQSQESVMQPQELTMQSQEPVMQSQAVLADLDAMMRPQEPVMQQSFEQPVEQQSSFEIPNQVVFEQTSEQPMEQSSFEIPSQPVFEQTTEQQQNTFEVPNDLVFEQTNEQQGSFEIPSQPVFEQTTDTLVGVNNDFGNSGVSLGNDFAMNNSAQNVVPSAPVFEQSEQSMQMQQNMQAQEMPTIASMQNQIMQSNDVQNQSSLGQLVQGQALQGQVSVQDMQMQGMLQQQGVLQQGMTIQGMQNQLLQQPVEEETGKGKKKKKEKPPKEKPIKEPKNKPRKGEMKPKSLTNKEGTKKKIIIGVGIVAVFLVLIIGMKAIKGLKSGSDTGVQSGDDFYSLLDEALTFKAGSFDYTIQVASEEDTGSTAVSETSASDASVEDLNNIDNNDEISAEEESAEEATEDESNISEQKTSNEVSSQKTLSAKSADWNAKSTNDRGYWLYPNYSFKITGMASSPTSCQFDITIGLEEQNDIFTSIYVVDDKCYVNLSKMKAWLEGSKNEYLVELSKNIPSSKEWVESGSTELQFISNYMDDDDNIEDATTNGFVSEYMKWLAMGRTLASALRNATGGGGMGATDTARTLSISSNDIDGNQMFINMLSPKSVYSTFVNNLGSLGLDKAHTAQLDKEYDNFASAFAPAIVGLSSNTTMPLAIQGTMSRLNEGNAVNQVEGSINLSYVYQGIKYTVVINLKANGTTGEIGVPEGETVALSEFKNPLVIDSTFDGLFKYLNFTDIETEYKNTGDVDSIIDKSLVELANYFNRLGVVNYKLNETNIKSFIQYFINSENLDEDDETDQAISKLITDYLTNMRNIDERIVDAADKSDSKVDKSKERYPTIKKKISKSGLNFTVRVDKKASTNKLLVVKCSVLNTNIDKVRLTLKDFALVKADSSSVSANDMRLLKKTGVSKDDVKDTVAVKATDSSKFTLYFPTNSEQGQSSLVFKTTEIGQIINY